VEQREKKVNLEDKVRQDQKLVNLESLEELDLLEKQVNEARLEFLVKTGDLEKKVKKDLQAVLELQACLAVRARLVFLVDLALTDQSVRKAQLVSLDFLEKQVDTAKTDILVFLVKQALKDLLVRAFLVLLARPDFQDLEAVLVQEELLEHLVLLAKMVKGEKLLLDRKESLACPVKMDRLEFPVTLANLD